MEVQTPAFYETLAGWHPGQTGQDEDHDLAFTPVANDMRLRMETHLLIPKNKGNLLGGESGQICDALSPGEH